MKWEKKRDFRGDVSRMKWIAQKRWRERDKMDGSE